MPRAYNEAIEHLDKAIQLNPEDNIYFIGRGLAKDALGNHDDAMADYDQAIKLDPEDIRAYGARGEAKTHVEDYEGANRRFY